MPIDLLLAVNLSEGDHPYERIEPQTSQSVPTAPAEQHRPPVTDRCLRTLSGQGRCMVGTRIMFHVSSYFFMMCLVFCHFPRLGYGGRHLGTHRCIPVTARREGIRSAR